MLALETSIQQLLKVELATSGINDLVSGLPELGRALALRVGTQDGPRAPGDGSLHLERRGSVRGPSDAGLEEVSGS